MRCTNCGSEVPDAARFCGECGYSFGSALVTSRDSTGSLMPESPPGSGSPVLTQAQPTAPTLAEDRARVQSPPTALTSPLGASPSEAAQFWGQPPAPPSASNNSSWQLNNSVSTTVNVGGPNILIAQRNSGPGLFVRGIWFLFIGWWLGYVVIFLAYLLIALIVTIPLGMGLLNRNPQVMTLRPRNTKFGMSQQDGMTVVSETTQGQIAWYWRALYFLPIGLVASFIWVNLAYAVGVFTLGLGLPLSFWMFNRVGAVATLYRT